MCGFCVEKLSIHLENYQRTWLLDHMVQRMLCFVWNHHQTFFQSGCANLHSHQQWGRAPVAPHPPQYLVLSVFWILAIVTGVYGIPLLWIASQGICNSLMTDDVEHLFLGLFALWMSSLIKYLFRSFALSLFGVFVFLLLNFDYSL